MEKSQILEAVSRVRAESKGRKFTQSIDLAISLRDVNLKDPSKRFRAEILIPYQLSKQVNLCVIGDDAIVAQAQEAGVKFTLTELEVENLAKNAKEAKSYIDKVDYFIAIPQLMANVGKLLGRFLGPAGKMPTVLPPNAPIDSFVTRLGRTVRLRLRQNPVLHCRAATEDMDDDQIAENILTILNEVEHRLENGANNISKVIVKSTMGPAIKIGA
jgi:large subunit ribosomal protein L1